MPRGIKSERVVVQCANCGKDIERRKTDRKLKNKKTDRFFCTRKCQYEAGPKPRRVPPKTCEQCGKEFMSYGARTGRFCSKACFDEWQRRNRVERTCEQCGTTFSVPPSYETRQPARFCTKTCEAASRIKRALDRTHNGRPAVVDGAGYVRVYEPDHPNAYKGGWLAEHRLVAEETLGRQLGSDEHVHHANGDKQDNRPENLVVMSHGEHSSITGLANGDRLREWAEYRKRYGPLEKE